MKLKAEQLKKLLAPIIKEIVKEVIFEEGVVSSLIKEVVIGMSDLLITEGQPRQRTAEQDFSKRKKVTVPRTEELMGEFDDISFEPQRPITETKRQSAPVAKKSSHERSAENLGAGLGGIDPNNSGCDLSLFKKLGVFK